MDLKQKALKGVKWTTLSTVVAGGLQLLQLLILARILTPTEFGVIAIIMVIVGFSQIFMDMGISNGIIHKQDVTKKQLSTLYWLNVLSGVFLFLVLNIFSNTIVNFYDIQELDYYILLLSFAYLIIPFGQQFMILFQKEMQFNIIAKTDILAHSIGFVTTISLAYLGHGILSFVIGVLVFFVARTSLFIYNGFKEYKPELYFNPRESVFFLKFGLYQMGERFINYFNTEIDILIIGKVLGPQTLGLYSVIKQLILRPMMVVNPVITKVYFPLMAKYQNEDRLISRIYISIINSVSSIMFPIYLTMFFMSKEIIIIFLGEQWIDAAIVLKILALYALFRSVANPVGALLMAKGRVDIGFYWNLGLLFIFPLFIYVGSFNGLNGVACALLLLGILLFIPNWYFQIYNVCKLKIKEYTYIISNVLMISLVSSSISFLFQYFVDGYLMKLIIFLVSFVTIYLALIKTYNKNIVIGFKKLIR